MESAPSHAKVDSLKKQFRSIENVLSVVDINIWQLKPGKILLAAKIVAEKNSKRQVLIDLTDISREKKIFHTAFEVTEREALK